jgi:hypothetical protein
LYALATIAATSMPVVLLAFPIYEELRTFQFQGTWPRSWPEALALSAKPAVLAVIYGLSTILSLVAGYMPRGRLCHPQAGFWLLVFWWVYASAVGALFFILCRQHGSTTPFHF